jgi:DNA-binding response OmpR family regulator
LRDIRLRTNVPVVIGLELGAGDCATAPFGIRELLVAVEPSPRSTKVIHN